MKRIDEGMRALAGHKIERAWLGRASDDQEWNVYLETAASVLCLEPVGDCCANAFIQHVSLADALVGATVREVEDIETTSVERDYGQTDTWGHRVHTDKGTCTFDMRTEHNGYYCGWFQVSEVDVLPAGARPLEDF